MDFEIKQSRQQVQSDFIDPNDRKAYIIMRNSGYQGGPGVL